MKKLILIILSHSSIFSLQRSIDNDTFTAVVIGLPLRARARIRARLAASIHGFEYEYEYHCVEYEYEKEGRPGSSRQFIQLLIQLGTRTMNLALHPDFTRLLSDDPLLAASDYYASSLTTHEPALEFAQQHFSMSAQELQAARIGYADRSLGKHIPSSRSVAGQQLRSQLISVGLFKANGRETLRGYVTQPIIGAGGQVIGIRGIKLNRSAAGPSEVVVGQAKNVDEGCGSQPQNATASGRASTTEGTENTEVVDTEVVDTEVVDAKVVDAEVVEVADTTHEATQPAAHEAKPEAKPSQATFEVDGDSIHWTVEDRRYRVGGLSHNATLWSLKINLLVSRDTLVHVDRIDLVKARSRDSFSKAAADALYVSQEIIRRDLGQLLMQLESYQCQRLQQRATVTQPAEMSDSQRQEALELLRDPDLTGRIVNDLQSCGCIGQGTSKLAIYLAATSRLLPSPLAMVVQSSSAAGKSSLLDSVLSLMPQESTLRLSNLSAQSLYYLGADSLSHRTLAISEDGGMHSVAYPLKLLQSEGHLRYAAVVKGQSGRLQTQQYEVTGPIQLMLTTTALELDEELLGRCLVVSVDESRLQTQAILDYQRRMRCFGQRELAESTRRQVRSLHHNAQRLLRPLWVNNPFAPQLTFSDTRTRIRRDHVKYLTLIDTICLLHQYQRTIHTFTSPTGQEIEYINVTRSDIELAGTIAGELLGRSLDELPPQTRRFLEQLHVWVVSRMRQDGLPQSAIRFTRRELRAGLPWSDWQLREHLAKLVAMEYILIHRGSTGKQFVYELLYDGRGQDGQPFVIGLVDANCLHSPSREVLHPR